MDPKESRKVGVVCIFSRDPGIFCVVAVMVEDSRMALEGNECGASSSSLAPYVVINSHFLLYSHTNFLDDADFSLSSTLYIAYKDSKVEQRIKTMKE